MASYEALLEHIRAKRMAQEMRSRARESYGFLISPPDSWDAETDEVIGMAIAKMIAMGMTFEVTGTGSGWTISERS